MTAIPRLVHPLTVKDYLALGEGEYRCYELQPCHLTEEFGYIDDGAVTGSFKTGAPFPVEIDLTLLR